MQTLTRHRSKISVSPWETTADSRGENPHDRESPACRSACTPSQLSPPFPGSLLLAADGTHPLLVGCAAMARFTA